jgi:hypothetical protein
MSSYINYLPSELKQEIQYVRNNVLGQYLNKNLCKRVVRETKETKEFYNYEVVYKSGTIPHVLNFELIYNSTFPEISVCEEYFTHIKIISTHLVTPSIIAELYNNMLKCPLGWRFCQTLIDDIVYINNALLDEGYTERLACCPSKNTKNNIFIYNNFTQ